MLHKKRYKENFERINLVDLEGKTSNRLKDYLSKFWEYYNASPALLKVLEKVA